MRAITLLVLLLLADAVPAASQPPGVTVWVYMTWMHVQAPGGLFEERLISSPEFIPAPNVEGQTKCVKEAKNLAGQLQCDKDFTARASTEAQRRCELARAEAIAVEQLKRNRQLNAETRCSMKTKYDLF